MNIAVRKLRFQHLAAPLDSDHEPQGIDPLEIGLCRMSDLCRAPAQVVVSEPDR